MRSNKDLSLKELHNQIVKLNEAGDLNTTGNDNTFFSPAPKNEQPLMSVPNVGDITLPKFKEYINYIIENNKQSSSPIRRAIMNGEPINDIKLMLNLNKCKKDSPQYHKRAKDILYKDQDGNTHFHLAVLVDKDVTYICELIKILIDAHIAIQKSNKYGMCPYHMAIAYDREDMLKASPYLKSDLSNTTWIKNKWNSNLQESSSEESTSYSYDFS